MSGSGASEKALDIVEDHVVLWAQENVPMPAYLRAEMLVEALERAGVLGSYGLQREQGLNVQGGGQAPSDRRPPPEHYDVFVG